MRKNIMFLILQTLLMLSNEKRFFQLRKEISTKLYSVHFSLCSAMCTELEIKQKFQCLVLEHKGNTLLDETHAFFCRLFWLQLLFPPLHTQPDGRQRTLSLSLSSLSVRGRGGRSQRRRQQILFCFSQHISLYGRRFQGPLCFIIFIKITQSYLLIKKEHLAFTCWPNKVNL